MTKGLKIKTILIPVDGSEASFKAAKYGIQLAKMANAEAIAMHAAAMPIHIPKTKKKIISPYFEEARKSAEDWMRPIINMARRENVKLRKDIVMNVASISCEIVNYAKKNNADLIVMGTGGRTGLKKFRLGSIAHGVVTLAYCPVLVVR